MRGCLALLLFFCVFLSASTVCDADEPQFVGKAGCASATCHGGIPGQGPAWHSSLRSWEAADGKHSHAGAVLLPANQLSKRIVDSLVRWQLGSSERISDEKYFSFLHKNCVSCHAPSAALVVGRPELDSYKQQLETGVSCESCHGPAAEWIQRHTSKNWDQTSSEAQASGMIATKSWEHRTDNCIKCHVGSRSEDGLIRDMNHDLIAAGHPVLRFDMTDFQSRLPAHWDIPPTRNRASVGSRSPAQQNASQPTAFATEIPNTKEDQSARVATADAVAKLAQERFLASQQGLAPYPEFADTNCADCHHSIRETYVPMLGNDSERYGAQ